MKALGKLAVAGVTTIKALSGVRRTNWVDDDWGGRDHLMQGVKDRRSLRTLYSLLRASGLDTTLRKRGPFTLLAPTDQAFAELGEKTLQALLKDHDRLRDVLELHVLERRLKTSRAATLKSVMTLRGERLEIDDHDGLKFGRAKVMKRNIDCSNGFLHIIDRVLTDD